MQHDDASIRWPTDAPRPPYPRPAELAPVRRGGWWVWMPLWSVGLLAWLPPLQAYRRTGLAWQRAFAIGLGVAAALLELAPHLVVPLVVVGVVVAHRVRADVPPGPRPRYRRVRTRSGPAPARPAPPHPAPPHPAPDAVTAAKAARARRDEVRELVRHDPALARDLQVGRPDLHRAYWDGGLVDLNHAPAAVLVHNLEWTDEQAGAVVAAREQLGCFDLLDEVPGVAGLDQRAFDRVRDRMVLVP